MANFSCKSQSVNILDFTDRGVSVESIQYCHCPPKAERDDRKVNEHSCVAIKHYLENRQQVLLVVPCLESHTRTNPYMPVQSDVGLPLLVQNEEPLPQ